MSYAELNKKIRLINEKLPWLSDAASKYGKNTKDSYLFFRRVMNNKYAARLEQIGLLDDVLHLIDDVKSPPTRNYRFKFYPTSGGIKPQDLQLVQQEVIKQYQQAESDIINRRTNPEGRYGLWGGKDRGREPGYDFLLSEIYEYDYVKRFGQQDNYDEMLRKRAESINKQMIQHPDKDYLAQIAYKGTPTCENSLWGRIETGPQMCDYNSLPDWVKEKVSRSNWSQFTNDMLLPFVEGNLKGNANSDKYNRQYVFGIFDDVLPYRYCTKYFRALSMEQVGEGELIGWDKRLNRLFTYCSLREDLLFPIRLILHSLPYARKYIYPEDLLDPKKYKYLGSLVQHFDFDYVDKRQFLIYFIFKPTDELYQTHLQASKHSGGFHQPPKVYLINHLYETIIPGGHYSQIPVTYNELGIMREGLNCRLPGKKCFHLYQHRTKPYIFFGTMKEPNEIPDNLMRQLNKVELVKGSKEDKSLKGVFHLVDGKGKSVLRPSQMKHHLPLWHFQAGGGDKTHHGLKFKLRTSQDFSVYDPELVGPEYDSFRKLHVEVENYIMDLLGFRDTHHPWMRVFKLAFDLGKYELVNPVDLTFNLELIKQYKTRLFKSQPPSNPWKRNPVDYWLDDVISKTILFYEPLSPHFVKYWEVLQKFDLTKPFAKTRNLEISGFPGFLEALYYYKKKTRSQKDTNVLLWPKYQADEKVLKYQKEFNYVYSRVIPGPKIDVPGINVKELDEVVTPSVINEWSRVEKFDLIAIAPRLTVMGISNVVWEQLNAPQVFSNTLLALSCLRKGGHFLLILNDIKTDLTVDLLIFLKTVFRDQDIYRPETILGYKETGITIVCRDFKGISEKQKKELLGVLADWLKLDPTGGHRFNVSSKQIREAAETRTWRKLSPNSVKDYPVSIVDYDKKDKRFVKVRDQVKEFNRKFYHNLIDFRMKLKSYADTLSNNPKYVDDVRKTQLIHSLRWAQENNLRLKPGVGTKVFHDAFGRSLINDLYSPHTAIKSEMETPTKDIVKIPDIRAIDQNVEDVYFNIGNLNDRYERVYTDIASRDRARYDQIVHTITFYQKSMKRYLAERYGLRTISQAWLKMYEIHNEFRLFDRRKRNIKSFHMCELPGGFISATNHFLKTETDNEKFDWHAQSLNPRRKSERDLGGIGDNFGLLRRHPNRWNFGADGTGDIRNSENIRYYRKYCEGIDFMTSDCGISWLERDALSKVFMGQLTFIFNNLPISKNFVTKMLMPFTSPLKVSMVYLVYLSFDHVYFYKPLQNFKSPEYYLIGLGYRGLPDRVIDGLFRYLENYKGDRALFDLEDLDPKFIVQLERIYGQLVDTFQNERERVIYYIDNYDRIPLKHWREISDIIEEKNREWAKKFNLSSLHSEDYL